MEAMQATLTLPGIEVAYDVGVAMADGVELATDIYLPAHGGPAPALLLRTPYGKHDVFNQGYAHPTWYASRGFAVVCQDVRGRWDSGGEFYPYAAEAEDGARTIAWVARQPWCSGKVGMYGFSYGGATQMLAATTTPPALAAHAPGMTGSNYGEGWTYQNGALNLAFILSWAAALGADQASRAGDAAAAASLSELLAHPGDLYARLPVRDAIPERLRKPYLPYLDHWLDHPDYDDYWKQWSPREHYPAIRIPGMHIAGWYDVFLEPTIENYANLGQQGEAPQMLVVGPWYHMPWSQYVGAVDFGETGRNVIDELQVRFFARWLKGERNGIDEEPPVRLFVMGANRWIVEDRWPPRDARAATFHLTSDGRANSLNGTGRLGREPGPGNAPPDACPINPFVPLTSLGGRSCCYAHGAPMGPEDQRSQEIRNDMLVYDSEPLDRDLTVIGTPKVALSYASNAPTTDVVVRLVDVHPDGRAINVSDAITRLPVSDVASRGVARLDIRMSPTAICLGPGHRLRLEVGGSSFPAHDRNPNTGASPIEAAAGEFRVATLFVFHDERHASTLDLPLVDG